MNYEIEKRLASKNGWMTPGEASSYYRVYDREGITVHWWGTPGKVGNHDATVNYILGQAEKGTLSVNYVVSNDKITELVEPQNVAFASNNGNPTTISIEFEPTLNDEGYRKAGWLIRKLENQFNRKLNIYPHSKWFATQCPGVLDLTRMRAEADKEDINMEEIQKLYEHLDRTNKNVDKLYELLNLTNKRLDVIEKSLSVDPELKSRVDELSQKIVVVENDTKGFAKVMNSIKEYFTK